MRVESILGSPGPQAMDGVSLLPGLAIQGEASSPASHSEEQDEAQGSQQSHTNKEASHNANHSQQRNTWGILFCCEKRKEKQAYCQYPGNH